MLNTMKRLVKVKFKSIFLQCVSVFWSEYFIEFTGKLDKTTVYKKEMDRFVLENVIIILSLSL